MKNRKLIINRQVAAFPGQVLLLGGTPDEIDCYRDFYQVQNPENEFYNVNHDEKARPDLIADFTFPELLHAFSDKKFDVVYFSGTPVNSITGAQKALANAYRLLKEDGVLVFRGMIYGSDKNTDPTMGRLLHNAGFETVLKSNGNKVGGEKIIAFKKKSIALVDLVQRIPVLKQIIRFMYGKNVYRMTEEGQLILVKVKGFNVKEECNLIELQTKLELQKNIKSPGLFDKLSAQWNLLSNTSKVLAVTGVLLGLGLLMFSEYYWAGIFMIKFSLISVSVAAKLATATAGVGTVKIAAIAVGSGALGTGAFVASRMNFSPSSASELEHDHEQTPNQIVQDTVSTAVSSSPVITPVPSSRIEL